MSTKIWVAYKLKDPNTLWDFVRDVKKQAITIVEKKLLGCEEWLLDSVDINSEEYKKELQLAIKFEREDPEKTARQNVIDKKMKKLYGESCASLYRDEFDFDVSINFRENKGDIYLIPNCDMQMRNVLDFLKDDERLEDFHYQNQTDPPDDIPYEEYQKRGEIWNEIDDRGWSNFLALKILSFQNYWRHSPRSQRMRDNLKE